jgi:arylsulfate sulfotransferase
MVLSFRVVFVLCLCAFAWVAVAASAMDGEPPRFASKLFVAPNSNPGVPLTAFIRFATDEPATVSIEINGKPPVVASRKPVRHHSIPVLGLRAGALNQVRLFLTDTAGNVSAPSAYLEIPTAPLPDDFPPIEARIYDKTAIEPGVTLFGVLRTDVRMSAILAIDEEGTVVWYWRGSREVTDVRRLRNGNLLFLEGTDAVEMDMSGNIIQRWRPTALNPTVQPPVATPVNVDIFHHEIAELPWDNLLTLSTEVRRYDVFPSSETDPAAAPAAANVVGDVIVEFARDGRVVNQWRLLDILDPVRIGYDSLSGFWNNTYGGVPTRDWAHANAVHYDESDDSFIVSMRHQDATVKVRRRDSQIVWILGTHDDWQAPWTSFLLRAVGALEWPFHQHAPSVTAAGTIVMFDNGNYRARPFDPKFPEPDSYSRAVEYRVDPINKTVSEAWSYGGGDDDVFFSPILGAATQLPITGNILVTDGARGTNSNGRPSDPAGGNQWARIVEVTHTQPPQKVFELVIGSPSRPPSGSWLVYRSTHLPGLYPEALESAGDKKSPQSSENSVGTRRTGMRGY